MEYKSLNSPNNLDVTTSIDDDHYIPQQQDLPNLYGEILKAFNEKNAKEIIFQMDKLKSYLSSFPITNPELFQDNIFHVITGLCSVTDNDDIVIYGFNFMNFIIENFVDNMPLLKEPALFDFCLPFLKNSNFEIVCLAFNTIVNFIRIQGDPRGRDYALNALSVNTIIQQFIETDSIEDPDIKILVQSKALYLLRAYTDYPLNQVDVSTIFKLCEIYLDEGSYWHLTGDSLSIILNFLQQYTDFQEFVLQQPEFSAKIVKFAYSHEPDDIINTLRILRFFIANNVEIPNQFFNNFLTLLIHNSQSVCSAAMDVLNDMVSPEKTNYIIQLIESDFFDKIETIFIKSSYEIKYKTVEIATLLLKQSTRILSDYIFLKKRYNILHCYLLFIELEDDSLSLFLLNTLYEVFIFHQYDSPTLFHEIGDEKDLISDLFESENQEIAEKAQIFYEQFLEPRLFREEPRPVQNESKPNVYFGSSSKRRRIKKMVKTEEPQRKVRKPLLIMSDAAFQRKKLLELRESPPGDEGEDHLEEENPDENEFFDENQTQYENDFNNQEEEYHFRDLYQFHFGDDFQNQDEDDNQFDE